MLEDVGAVLVLAREIGRHVRQDRVLVEVVADHARDEVVHDLVVDDTRPDRVREADVAAAIGLHQAGHAQHRVRPEHLRVEEVVVDPAVDHVHLLQAPRRAHVDARVAHQEVAPLHDRDAHLARQIGVLEVGAVVRSRGEQHHVRVARRARRDVPQRAQQVLGVELDRLHVDRLEEGGKAALHRAAVLEHVAHAGRAARVVLEHQVVAVRVADQVGAADVHVDVAGHLEAHELAPEVAGGEHEVRRHDAVLHDLLLVVDVVQEQVERGDPLHEARLDLAPLLRGDEPRHHVEREDPLGPRLVAVDVEGDALAQEGAVDGAPALGELGRREAAPQLVDPAVVRAHAAVGSDHLVVDAVGRRIRCAPPAAAAAAGLVARFEHLSSLLAKPHAERASRCRSAERTVCQGCHPRGPSTKLMLDSEIGAPRGSARLARAKTKTLEPSLGATSMWPRPRRIDATGRERGEPEEPATTRPSRGPSGIGLEGQESCRPTACFLAFFQMGGSAPQTPWAAREYIELIGLI